MTRHGKNCTAGAVYTYHEKKKDTGEIPPAAGKGHWPSWVRGTGRAGGQGWTSRGCGSGVRGTSRAGLAGAQGGRAGLAGVRVGSEGHCYVPGDPQPGPSSAEEAKQLPSFWIPSLTPEAKASVVRKPDRCVYCPMSGRPLKLQDLTPVHFTLLDPAVDRVGLINRQDRYVCAVTRDMLGNSVPCAVLRASAGLGEQGLWVTGEGHQRGWAGLKGAAGRQG
uniref:Nitric oxide synthase-interacting protein zinc-finger domain-containing protein n=1 Tax=Gopherus agassizii TaxID=38772 RepID=A0A452H9H8_9SAUR